MLTRPYFLSTVCIFCLEFSLFDVRFRLPACLEFSLFAFAFRLNFFLSSFFSSGYESLDLFVFSRYVCFVCTMDIYIAIKDMGSSNSVTRLSLSPPYHHLSAACLRRNPTSSSLPHFHAYSMICVRMIVCLCLYFGIIKTSPCVRACVRACVRVCMCACECACECACVCGWCVYRPISCTSCTCMKAHTNKNTYT